MTEEENQQEPETPVETSTVHVRVKEAVTYKKIKNAEVTLLQGTTECATGLTDYTGEVVFEDVPYGAYTLTITRTGYEDYSNNLNVNGPSILAPPFMTHLPVDPNNVEVDLDERYTFTITGQITHDYSFTSNVIEWLQANLEGLKDDYLQPLFGKVNTGFNDSTLKTFGKKPVCDVYINTVEYTGDFDNHYPEKVKSIVIVYLKGANNHTYGKACELHDLLMQEFITNEDFRRLDDIVSETYITNSELRVQPLQKKWGVIVAFELTHDLY